MSNISNYIDYIRMLMQAVIDGRIEAKAAQAMTPEEHEAYHQQLIADEKAEIERGKRIDAGGGQD